MHLIVRGTVKRPVSSTVEARGMVVGSEVREFSKDGADKGCSLRTSAFTLHLIRNHLSREGTQSDLHLKRITLAVCVEIGGEGGVGGCKCANEKTR